MSTQGKVSNYPDADLIPTNIRVGIDIFGVVGSMSPSLGGSSLDLGPIVANSATIDVVRPPYSHVAEDGGIIYAAVAYEYQYTSGAERRDYSVGSYDPSTGTIDYKGGSAKVGTSADISKVFRDPATSNMRVYYTAELGVQNWYYNEMDRATDTWSGETNTRSTATPAPVGWQELVSSVVYDGVTYATGVKDNGQSSPIGNYRTYVPKILLS